MKNENYEVPYWVLEVMADMVEVKRVVTEGKEKNAKLVKAVTSCWGMLYADDAGIVAKSPESL